MQTLNEVNNMHSTFILTFAAELIRKYRNKKKKKQKCLISIGQPIFA